MTSQSAQRIKEQFKVSEVELIYRSKVMAKDRPKITDSKTAYEILLQSWDENKIELQEQFKILLLNTANRCLGIAEIGTGGLTSCTADPRLIFSIALKGKASGIILAHNHPSGNLQPSQADLELTKKIINGAKLLDVKILDHLIITSEEYKSFSDDALLPF